MLGQFAPQNLTKNLDPKWAHHTALSRTEEITQFLSQGADVITFQIIMHDRDAFTGSSEKDINLLQSWAKADPLYGNRPPTLTFWVGQGWEMMDCIITGLSNIQYEEPTILGTVQGVTADITLRAYSEFSIDAKGNFDTRYHRAVTRDYYELLAWREYRAPILGDVIRKDHPDKANIQIGDAIKLPSVESVRKKSVKTTSVVLEGAYGKKLTPAKQRRIDMFEARNDDYVSHIVVE